MSATDGDVACRCGAPARVSRVELAPDGETTMIELMHVYDDVHHAHQGTDLDALMSRLRLVNEIADDDGY